MAAESTLELSEVLNNILSSENSVREQAELTLVNARRDPSFLSALADLALQQGLDIAVRRLALSHIQKLVKDEIPGIFSSTEENLILWDKFQAIFLKIILRDEDAVEIKDMASNALGEMTVTLFDLWHVEPYRTLVYTVSAGTDVQVRYARRTISKTLEVSKECPHFGSVLGKLTSALLNLGILENKSNWMEALVTTKNAGATENKCNCFLCQLMTVLVTGPMVSYIAQLLLIHAHHVLEFLSKCKLEEEVLGWWLEERYATGDTRWIQQNIIPLSKLFILNDRRVSQIMVKEPSRGWRIPAPLRMLKLILRGTPDPDVGDKERWADPIGENEEEGDENKIKRFWQDENWEDDADPIDLLLRIPNDPDPLPFNESGDWGTRESFLIELFSMDGIRRITSREKERDDEMLYFVGKFFVKVAHENEISLRQAYMYEILNKEEQEKLLDLARWIGYM